MKCIFKNILIFLFTSLLVLSGCLQVPAVVEQPSVTAEVKNETATATVMPTQATDPSPMVSDEQKLANLIAFSRMYGYIRYFHPSDQVVADDINWLRIAMGGISAVRDADNPVDLAGRLQNYFQPLAPTVQVFVINEETPPLPDALELPSDATDVQVVMWEHFGVADELPVEFSNLSSYSSYRLFEDVLDGEIPDGFHDPREPYYADLGGGVAVHIPLGLFVGGEKTIPHLDIRSLDQNLQIVSETSYLAGVVVTWNALQHFYPYFDVVDTNWEQVLSASLAAAMKAENDKEYSAVIQAMLAALQDGHARLINTTRSGQTYPPVRLAWIDDKLMISYLAQDAPDGLRLGDLVISIDHHLATDLLIKTMDQFSGSEQYRRQMALDQILLGDRGKIVRIEVETPDGERKEFSVKRTEPYFSQEKVAQIPPTVELEAGIFYIDLTRVDEQMFQRMLPELQSASGIIFDLRGYPTPYAGQVLTHLFTEPVKSQQFLIPITTWPDQKHVKFEDVSWSLAPQEPYLAARKIFLIDANAISYSETLLSIVEHYQLAELIGEPTAGANGDINAIRLPRNLKFYWTGLKVLSHDETQFHTIGVQPTIPVSRSWQGIIDGRDEQLEAALELLRP